MMSAFSRIKLVALGAIPGSLLFLYMPPVAAADDSVQDELRRCSQIVESADRLSCYDALSRRGMPEPVEASAVPAAEKTLDDLGRETMPRSAAEAEKLEVRATVVRCEKDARKKYLFYFENGQVWRQASDKRVYFKDCNFDVTISKDFFGYKMQKDGDKGRIRISRVK